MEEIEASTQVAMCVSFLIAIVAESDLLDFAPDESSAPAAELTVKKKRLAFELFGDGGQGDVYKWKFLTIDDETAVDHLHAVGTRMFRHVYSDAKQRNYDREACIERCKIVRDPFPTELLEASNVDILANFCMAGLIPVVVLPRFRKRLPDLSLINGTLTPQQMTQETRLKLSVARSLAKHTVTRAHALARVGHVGILVETGIVLGGAAYDAFYDRQNLLRNVRLRGKLGAASAAGGAVGAAIGLAVPIPGFVFLSSVAGSVAGRWMASQFVSEGAEGPVSDSIAPSCRPTAPASQPRQADADIDLDLLELDEAELELMELEQEFKRSSTIVVVEPASNETSGDTASGDLISF